MPKAKPVNYRLLPRFDPDGGEEHEAYRLLDGLVRQHHVHLLGARIALCWRYGWSADKDDRLKLGQCKKASDFDREFHAYDVVILLNFEVWNNERFPLKKKLALLEHELMHAQLEFDSRGDVKKDERDRICYRIRAHDLEEFRDVVTRHGAWKQDLELFAKALLAGAAAPLFAHVTVGKKADERRAESPLPAPEPLPDDGEDLPWYKRPVTALKLSGGVIRALQLSGLATLGALNMYLQTDANLQGIAGINGEAPAIRDALGRLKPVAKEEKKDGDA